MLKFRRSGLKTETIVPEGDSGKGQADVVNNNNNNDSGSSSGGNKSVNDSHLDNRRISGEGKSSRFGYNVNKSVNELAMSQKVMLPLLYIYFNILHFFAMSLMGKILCIQ